MTRVALEEWARKIWSEAFAVDPDYTIEVSRAVTGDEVFAWSALSCRQLEAMSRGLFATARLS